MQEELIDTHAHIYLPEFDSDRQEMMNRAVNNGVSAIYLPAIDSSAHEAMLETERSYPFCKCMMGLHPCSVNEHFEKELLIVKEYLLQRPFIAVGEIGLDFYWDKTFTAQQYQAFQQQIETALAYGLPVVVHSRNATDECIEVVSQYDDLKGVFHCFSGNEQQAKRLIELGFYLGIGGVLTFKNSGLDKVVHAIGLSNLVLETDAPYLAPMPFRGKRNEPAYTRLIVDKLAGLLHMPADQIIKITTANAKTLFQMKENP